MPCSQPVTTAPLGAYVTLGMLIGARNEELRALTWDHVDLVGDPDDEPPVPPSIRVWRSVRAGGDTKTRLSRRTLGLPAAAVEGLGKHRAAMHRADLYDEHRLVFCTGNRTALDSSNVRRMFRNICAKAGLDPAEWTPRELRQSFVYRKQLRPVLTGGAQVMDTLSQLSEDAGSRHAAES